MTAVILAVWLGVSTYLLGRGLMYLAALLRAPSRHWLRDARLWVLSAPFLLPVAFYFYRADPTALVIVVLAFAMLLGWSALYVFRTLLSEVAEIDARVHRQSHVAGAAVVAMFLAVVLWALG